jgi:hypothetical protein
MAGKKRRERALRMEKFQQMAEALASRKEWGPCSEPGCSRQADTVLIQQDGALADYCEEHGRARGQADADAGRKSRLVGAF